MAKKRGEKFNISTYICADKDDLPFWVNILQGSDTRGARVRVNIETEEEFLASRKAIEAAANVRFTVESSKKNPRYQWTKVFGCHHGTHKGRASKNPIKKTG